MSAKSPTTTAGITVGELIRQLAVFPESADLSFSGLRFYRLKSRAPDVVQLEFVEQVYRDRDGTLVVSDMD